MIPRFAEARAERERAKAECLVPAIEAALARRSPAREPPAGYLIDEPAELERAARARRAGGLRERVAELGEEARRWFAFGFEGDIAHELEHHASSGPPSRWTLRVRDGRRPRYPGRAESPR